MIVQMKILLKRPIEMVAMWNLYVVKLLQFSMLTIACTLDILSNQAQFGILKHVVNLLPGVIRERNKLRQAWTLRVIREEPSPTCFESHTSPNPIMNILIWNCRGAMKPTFQKSFGSGRVALANYFCDEETRIDGPKTDDIIRRLPLIEHTPQRPLVMLAEYGFCGT